MSISSVNPYMSIMAAYKAAQEKSNAESTVQEVAETKPTTRPGDDTVSISDAGHAKSQASSIKTQAQDMYEKYFKPSGMIYIPPEKPINELLPENQALIQTLRDEQANTASLERRQEIQARISLISAYGDAEVFHNEAEVAERREVLHLATNMLFKEAGKPEISQGAKSYDWPFGVEDAASSTNEKVQLILKEWKQAGAPVFPGIKPIDVLLPESQDFIARMKEEQKIATPERKVEIENHIAFVRAYGDKEPFVSEESIFNMHKILGEVTKLAANDMQQNSENWSNVTRFNKPIDKYALAGRG